MKRHTSAWWIKAGVFVGVTGLAAVLAGTSFAWNEHDDGGRRANGFSNRSIKGYYGYNSSYSVLVATGPNQPVVPALPFAGMGRIYFDGQVDELRATTDQIMRDFIEGRSDDAD